MKIQIFSLCFVSALSVVDIPWDSSNVVIAYYGNGDSECRDNNAVKLDIRSSTECYEDAYTQYECEPDGTITYTEYWNENCTDANVTGTFAPNDMGCMQYSNDTELFYRYFCYSDMPESLDPYRSGQIIFPYQEAIYNDRGDSENCTAEPAAWELLRPNYCFAEDYEEPVVWERIDDSQWNINVYMYNDTDCVGAAYNETMLATDGTCHYIYEFSATYDTRTNDPSARPSDAPSMIPSDAPTTDSPTPRPTGVPVVTFAAEFETTFQLNSFPCDSIDDLENDPQAVAAILEAGYVNADGDSGITVVIESITVIGDSCSSAERRLLQDATASLDVVYTTYCASENTCVDLEEETTATFLEETLVQEMAEEYEIETTSFGVEEESVTTSAVTDSSGDTVETKNKKKENGLDAGATAGISISVIVFVFAIGGLLFWYYRYNNNNNKGSRLKDEIQMGDQTDMNETLMDEGNGTTTNGTTGGTFVRENDDLL